MPPDASPPPTGLARLKAKVRAWVGEPGSPRRVIARNSAWEVGGFVLTAVVMFFLTPFIVNRLGDSLYGVWVMIFSLTGFLSFADLGVRPAAVHYIARHDARADHDAVNAFVNTAFVTFAAGGLVIIALAVPLSFWLPRFWRIASGFAEEATLALLIVAGEVALTLPLNAFSAVLVGKQRYDRMGMVRVPMTFVRAGLILLVLSEGWGLVALATVHAGLGLLEMAIFTLTAFRIAPYLRFAPRLASKQAFRSLLKFGGWAVAVIVARQINWSTDSLVIGRAISDAAVAWFAVGFKLAWYARELLYVGSRVVEPAIAALHGVGDKEGIRRLLTNSVRVMLLFAGPIVIYLLVVGEPFLRRWMADDPEYAVKSSGVLIIMTLAIIPVVASAPLMAAFYGTNRVRPLSILVTIEAVLNLGLSVTLVGPHGIDGVALGTAIPAYLVHGALMPWVLCRAYGLSWTSFVLRTWVGPVLAAVLPYHVLSLLVDPKGVYGYPLLFGLAGLSVVLYGLCALALHKVAPWLMGSGPLLKVEVPGEDDA